MSNHDIDRQAIMSCALRHGFTLRDCHSRLIKNHDPDPCSYRMRITDPGCTGCAERDEDQSTEAGG